MGLHRHRVLQGALIPIPTASLRAMIRVFFVLALITQVALAQEPDKASDNAKPKEATTAPVAPKQKVLGLRIEGFELSAKSREDLFNVVQQRLQAYPSIELVRPPDEELTDLMIDLGCLDIDVDCLTKVGRKRMADRVFYAQVDVVDKGYRLTVRLIDVTKGHAERDRQAMVSNQTELTTSLEREIVAAFGAPPPPPPKDGRLIIESDAGAKIYIDGGFAGSGRVKLKKPPGLYVVRVSKQGYEDALFRVDLEAGRTARKVAELKPIQTDKTEAEPTAEEPEAESEEVAGVQPVVAEPPPEFYKTWWFWTVVGSVVVSATTLGVVMGLDSKLPPVGDVQISIDPNSAWRDVSIQAGSVP